MQSHLRRVQFQQQQQGPQDQQKRRQRSRQDDRKEQAPPHQPPPGAAAEDEMTYYELLRVPADAAPEAIKAAYHQRLKEYHPDLHSSSGFDWIKSEAERMSRKIGEAYEVLADPARRSRYDSDLRRRGRRSS